MLLNFMFYSCLQHSFPLLSILTICNYRKIQAEQIVFKNCFLPFEYAWPFNELNATNAKKSISIKTQILCLLLVLYIHQSPMANLTDIQSESQKK